MVTGKTGSHRTTADSVVAILFTEGVMIISPDYVSSVLDCVDGPVKRKRQHDLMPTLEVSLPEQLDWKQLLEVKQLHPCGC